MSSPDGTMKVSIIIRCKNEEKYIGQALDAVRAQHFDQPYEIILVDSGSTDGTLATAHDRDVDVVIDIPQKEFTFGKAINFGCEAANGEYIVLLSAHCIPDSPHWLQHLLAPLADESISMTYGRQIGKRGANPWSEICLMDRLFPSADIQNADPTFCNNANSAFQRKLWQRYRFNEQVTGLEDLEWATRLHRLGRRTHYVASAPVIHIHEETPAQVFRRFKREAKTLFGMGRIGEISQGEAIRSIITDIWRDALATGSLLRLIPAFASIVTFQSCRHWGTMAGSTHQVLSREEERRLYRHEEA